MVRGRVATRDAAAVDFIAASAPSASALPLQLPQGCSFLDASSHLYKRVCPSVRPSVRRSVGPSVRPSVAFVSNTRKRVNSTSEEEGMSRGGRGRKEG